MKDKLEPIKVPSLKDDFVKQFENLILSGKITVGEKLPSERELALQMEVSRPVVHDGLLQLAAKGLITIKPRHGSVVNDYRKAGSVELLNSLLHYSQGRLGPEILKGIEDLRLVIEKEAIEYLIKQNDKTINTCLKELSNSVKRSNNQVDSGKKKLAEEDFTFHHSLLCYSGNIIYPLLLNSFKEVYINILSEYFYSQELIKKISVNKINLINSIAGRDLNMSIKRLEILVSTNTYIDGGFSNV